MNETSIPKPAMLFKQIGDDTVVAYIYHIGTHKSAVIVNTLSDVFEQVKTGLALVGQFHHEVTVLDKWAPLEGENLLWRSWDKNDLEAGRLIADIEILDLLSGVEGVEE